MTFLRAVSDENGRTEAKAMINPTITTAAAIAVVRHGCRISGANLDCRSIIRSFQIRGSPIPVHSLRAAGVTRRDVKMTVHKTAHPARKAIKQG